MKNVVICINIDKKSIKGLRRVADLVPLSESNVTLLHVWNKRAYNYPSDMIIPFYPSENQDKEIEQEMKKKLDEQLGSLSGLSISHFKTHVFSSSTPKKDSVEFLKKEKADLVVCFSAEKNRLENFFHSSFTNYLSAHAPCDVLNLRISK